MSGRAGSLLRVGIDARSRTGSTGGVQQFTLGVLHSLRQVSSPLEEYFALSYPDDRDWLEPALGQRVHALEAPLPATRRGLVGAVRRAAVQHIPALRRLRAQITTRRTDANLPRSDGTIERAGIEVMHFVRQMAFLTDVPSIYHPWDLQHIHLPEFFTDAQRRHREVAYRTYCDRAARIVAPSTWMKDDLVETYDISEDRIIVIPVAQDPEAYPVPSAADLAEARSRFSLPERFLLYPAQTWAHKNHLRLIEALALLRDAHRASVDLILTGYLNEHYPKIRRQVDRLHLGDRVRFLGYVTPVQLQALYRLAVGMVFPSLFEGWGIPIVEAFQAGTPVACSNATSLPSMVGDAAFVFDPYDVESIAAAVLALWTDDSMRQQLAERGSARLLQFDPGQVGRTYRALYREVAGTQLDDQDRAALSAPPTV